ncbi:transglutaminase domain-containing protein [Nonomuraea insulae]|uniref:Transglutaminase domain-containing protein n=1 Tax=Nonomuraea insulae TaxID=1616787 RepID=A0ABW1D875_9ACTN
MPVPLGELERVTECVRRIPDSYRQYSVPAAKARSFFRIPPDVLEGLLDLGLPRGAGGNDMTFDEHDLKSIVFLLRLPSPQLIAFRAMSDALERSATGLPARRTVNIQARCPNPGHEGPCDFELSAKAKRHPDVTEIRRVDPRHFAVELLLPGRDPTYFCFTPEQEQLAREVRRMEFLYIPFDLNDDLAFLADSGLADCRLATHFLYTRGRELGVPVRRAAGLFLSKPFSNRHFWVEFKHEGQWLPADPFFLPVLQRLGMLDGSRWPQHRSPLDALWKLDADPDKPLITHRAGAPASYLTR